MRPMLRRIRNGEFTVTLTDARDGRESAAAAEFQRQFRAWVGFLESPR